MKRTVDVLIPAYNPGHYFELCLESCAKQTYPGPFRIIVADDGSTEDLLSTIKKYRSKLDILYLRSEVNLGVAAARNAGLKKATGELLFFHDADDIMCPARIEATVAAFDNNPELVLVCGNWRWIIDGELEPRSRYAQEHPIEYATLLFDYPICSATVAIKRKILETTGEFNESYPVVEDYDLWIRIVKQFPDQLKYVHRDFIYHHRHATPYSLTKRYMWTEEHHRILEELKHKYRLV